MRILGINGAWCWGNPVPRIVAAEFAAVMPVSEIVIAEDTGRHPWQIRKMRCFTRSLVDKYDDGVDTLIIGHSMGGVTACAVAKRMKKTRVLGIVTINSPHKFLGGVFTRALGAHGYLPFWIITFQARYDELVWWGSRHPQSMLHTKLYSNHYTDLVDFRHNAEIIAEVTKRGLFPKAQDAT